MIILICGNRDSILCEVARPHIIKFLSKYQPLDTVIHGKCPTGVML